jgi:1-acyl-sn-glycerol-3-phosphate acyltransferase
MFLRNAIWTVYAAISVTLCILAIVLLAAFPYRVPFAVCNAWCVSMLFVGRFLCGIRYVVEGTENLPAEPSVVLIKHSSLFETYAQVALFPANTWVVKHELLSVPIFGWGVRALKAIAIDRESGASAVKQVIEQGKQRLADGVWITVFPEGTRMAPGCTRHYGVSGAALARAANCQIVPVAHNAADLWATNGYPQRPGLIRIVIGPPIDAQGRPPKETNLMAQEWIESKMREISEGYQQRPR